MNLSQEGIDLKAQLRSLLKERDELEAEVNERTSRLNAPGQPGMKGPLIDDQGFPRADVDVVSVRADRIAVLCRSNDHKAMSKRIDAMLEQLHSLTRVPSPAHAAAAAAAPTASVPEVASATMQQDSTTAGVSSAGGTGGAPACPADVAASDPMEVDGGGSGPKRPREDGALPPVLPPPAASAVSQPLQPFALVDEVSGDSPASSAGLQVGDQLCSFGTVASRGAGGIGDELTRVAQLLQASEGVAVATVVLRQGRAVTLSLTPQRWTGRGLLGCHLRPLR